MKNLILILLTSKLFSQDCYTDINRQTTYNRIEIYIKNSGYHKLKNDSDTLNLTLTLNPKEKTIFIHDSINYYDKEYKILWCAMLDTALIYWCKDIQRNFNCFLVFSGQNEKYYDLTFYYEYKKIIYRIRKRK